MHAWRHVRSWFRRLRRRGDWERSISEELQSYVEHDIDARVATGQQPDEARRAALVELGGIEQIREEVRQEAPGAGVDGLIQDLRCAFRSLGQSRRYLIWVLASLTIGMSAAVAGFTLLVSSMFAPFPEIADQHRLVEIALSRTCGAAGRQDCWNHASYSEDYAELRAELPGLSGLAGFYGLGTTIALPDSQSARAAITSTNYFDVLGVRPVAGRFFDTTDESSNAPVVVISEKVWVEKLDADLGALGRHIRVGDQFAQIIGIAPSSFVGTEQPRPPQQPAPDAWLPTWIGDRLPAITDTGQVVDSDRRMFFVGRLKEGAQPSEVKTQLDVIAQRRADSEGVAPGFWQAETRGVWRVNPSHWGLGAMVILPVPLFVLVISCINAANLMLARWSHRRREMAIRLAIGGGRSRIIRQLLLESAILTVVSATFAIPIAWFGLEVVGAPWGMSVSVDWRVIALTVFTAGVATITSGLAPAVRASAQTPAAILGSAGVQAGAIPKQSRVRQRFIIVQAGLSLALLATGQQFVATVQSQAAVGGVPADRVFIAQFNLGRLGIPPTEADRFYSELLTNATHLPGVEAAGLARHSAVWIFGRGKGSASFSVQLPTDAPGESSVVRGGIVNGGYAAGDLFGATGLRLVSGRSFTTGDRASRAQVAIVNESLADNLDGPALGRLLLVAPRDGLRHVDLPAIEVRVIGIIESAREPQYDQDRGATPKLYLPSPVEDEPALALYLRTQDDAMMLAEPVRRLVSSIDPNVPIQQMGSLEQFNEQSYGEWLWLANAAAVLGVIGLVLAAAGLYGVASYVAGMRSREIAVRLALGARPRVILAMVMRQSVSTILAGLVVGAVLSAIVGRIVQSGYHGVAGIDPFILSASAVFFLVAMLVANALPALQVARLNPVLSLKHE